MKWFQAAVLALGLSTVCAGQIFELATTDDGSDLYITSTGRLRGSSSQFGDSTIFRLRDGAWTVVSESAANDFVVGPAVSGDGRIVLWRRERRCFGRCMFFIPNGVTEGLGIDGQSIGVSAYGITISRNGRFVASGGFGPPLPAEAQDLSTGEKYRLPLLAIPSNFHLGDDGTIIGFKATAPNPGIPFPTVSSPKTIVRWRPGEPARDIFVSDQVQTMSLSADGQVAAVELIEGNTRRIVSLNLETGQTRTLSVYPAGTADREYTRLSVSADGQRVLWTWRGAPDVWLWDSALGEARALGVTPDRAALAVMSTNGAAAWVVTLKNRLLRVNLAGSETASEETLGEFPGFLARLYSGDVPGSAALFHGEAPEGVRATLDGLEFPRVAVDEPSVTGFQIPWEVAERLPADRYTEFQLVLRKEGHPFEIVVRAGATNTVRPIFRVYGEQNLLRAATQDFSAAITVSRPAKPGETIHFWLTGMGPLDRPVPTGVPGPSDPPARPVAPIACAIFGRNNVPSWRGAELPFVAYAPGLVGSYQVDLTIPKDWPAGLHTIACYTSNSRPEYAQIPVGQ